MHHKESIQQEGFASVRFDQLEPHDHLPRVFLLQPFSPISGAIELIDQSQQF